MDAKTLAERLYLDDLLRTPEVPIERSGHVAYKTWLRAASEAGDTDTLEELHAIDSDEFIDAWDQLVLENVEKPLTPDGPYEVHVIERHGPGKLLGSFENIKAACNLACELGNDYYYGTCIKAGELYNFDYIQMPNEWLTKEEAWSD